MQGGPGRLSELQDDLSELQGGCPGCRTTCPSCRAAVRVAGRLSGLQGGCRALGCVAWAHLTEQDIRQHFPEGSQRAASCSIDVSARLVGELLRSEIFCW